jgi:hypothetical protein
MRRGAVVEPGGHGQGSACARLPGCTQLVALSSKPPAGGASSLQGRMGLPFRGSECARAPWLPEGHAGSRSARVHWLRAWGCQLALVASSCWLLRPVAASRRCSSWLTTVTRRAAHVSAARRPLWPSRTAQQKSAHGAPSAAMRYLSSFFFVGFCATPYVAQSPTAPPLFSSAMPAPPGCRADAHSAAGAALQARPAAS